MLVAYATGQSVDEAEYKSLHSELRGSMTVRNRLPGFVQASGELRQCWRVLRPFETYQARREFLSREFRPLIAFLEGQCCGPIDGVVAESVGKLGVDHVSELWQKCIERRENDPEGAITAARSMVESVCKCILNDGGVYVDERSDLGKLYRTTIQHLKLSPDRKAEQAAKQILSGCVSIVSGIAAARNVWSDAHGSGIVRNRPTPSQVWLVINAAATLAMFLVGTWEDCLDKAA